MIRRMAVRRDRRIGQLEEVVEGGRINTNLFSKLPLFSGSPKEDFTAFIAQFEIVSNAMNLQTPGRSRILPVCLSGFAQHDFLNAPQIIHENYDHLLAHLHEKFLQPEVLQRCALELTKRKQTHSESISDYMVALRNLSKRSFADNENVHISDRIL